MLRFIRGFSGFDYRHGNPMVDTEMQTISIPIVLDAHSSTNSLSTTPMEDKFADIDFGAITETDNEAQIVDLENELLIETTFIDKLVKDQFTCPICRNLIVKAHSINCGHNFCYTCLDSWKKRSQQCPLCREKMNFIAPSHNIDRFLQDLVLCYGTNLMKKYYSTRQNQAINSLRIAEESIDEDLGPQTTARYIQTYSHYEEHTMETIRGE